MDCQPEKIKLYQAFAQTAEVQYFRLNCSVPYVKIAGASRSCMVLG